MNDGIMDWDELNAVADEISAQWPQIQALARMAQDKHSQEPLSARIRASEDVSHERLAQWADEVAALERKLDEFVMCYGSLPPTPQQRAANVGGWFSFADNAQMQNLAQQASQNALAQQSYQTRCPVCDVPLDGVSAHADGCQYMTRMLQVAKTWQSHHNK